MKVASSTRVLPSSQLDYIISDASASAPFIINTASTATNKKDDGYVVAVNGVRFTYGALFGGRLGCV